MKINCDRILKLGKISATGGCFESKEKKMNFPKKVEILFLTYCKNSFCFTSRSQEISEKLPGDLVFPLQWNDQDQNCWKKFGKLYVFK